MHCNKGWFMLGNKWGRELDLKIVMFCAVVWRLSACFQLYLVFVEIWLAITKGCKMHRASLSVHYAVNIQFAASKRCITTIYYIISHYARGNIPWTIYHRVHLAVNCPRTFPMVLYSALDIWWHWTLLAHLWEIGEKVFWSQTAINWCNV